MNKISLFLFALLIAALAFFFLHERDGAKEFDVLIRDQETSFCVPIDSAATTWQRALSFLEDRKRMISGGRMVVNDSLIRIPYFNGFKKGNSLLVKKQIVGERACFEISWWYGQHEALYNAQELSLYMQKGWSRY